MAVLVLLVVPLASAGVDQELDYVNIGDTASEAGHDINGWSAPWTWGGCYGGGDDGTLRTVLPRDASCMTDDKIAYFKMSTDGVANRIELRHLLGSQNDGYELYIKDGEAWTKLSVNSSSDRVCGACNSAECWYTDSYSFSDRTGDVEFKIVALTTPASWCSSWGLNAFSWAKLYGQEQQQQIPEFSAIAAGIALLGSGAAFITLRKRK